METLIKFKSFICRYEDFESVGLLYPEDPTNGFISVEVCLKNGEKIVIFAAAHILTCWMFLESMELIKPKEKVINGQDHPRENLFVFDKDGKIKEHIDALKDEALQKQMDKMCENIIPGGLPHEMLYCCYTQLEYLKDVAVGKKWHCKICDEKYSSEDLALKKNIKKGSH